jgi:hypothetical protein
MKRSSLVGLALVVALAGCDAPSPAVTTPQTVPPPPPDPATVTNDELLSWSLAAGCEEPGDAADLLPQGIEWVVIENTLARTLLARNGRNRDLVISRTEATRVLTGNAPLGTALDAATFVVLERALHAGADVIAASFADRPEHPDSPEPQMAYFVVLTDGRAAWLGPACSPSLITAPLLAYLEHLDPTDGRAVTEALISRDPAVLADFLEWYQSYLHETEPEPLAWTDLPPDQRSVDVEDTPAEILATVSSLEIFIEVPDEWADWAVSFCGRSDLGHLGCTLAQTGTNSFPVLVDPAKGFDLILLDESARFGSDIATLVSVTPETVAAALQDGNALHFAPSGAYASLDQIVAAPPGSAYTVTVAARADLWEQLMDSGD